MKYACGKFRLASIDRRNHATACSQLAELIFRLADVNHPGVSLSIARTETQGLGNVGLSLFGVADENLSLSDKGVGSGKISIERQRVLTFSNALCRALGPHVDNSQQHMRASMVRD